MRRMAILGCSLLLVAGCGGGGSSDVEEMMQIDPAEPETGSMEPEPGSMEPAMSPTLVPTGQLYEEVVDGIYVSYNTTYFHNWGVWGGILRDDYVSCTAIGCPPPGETIFMAYINHEIDGAVSTTTQGMQSGTSPEMGSAVWTGDVLAYESVDVGSGGNTVTTYQAVTGESQLEVDFTANIVDIDFTNFDYIDSGMSWSRADMSWDGLAMENGAFGDETAGIEGSFYGADHEGAAGTFARDGLTGVFGALRSSD